MQNHLLAILNGILRVLRLSIGQLGGTYVLPRSHTDPVWYGVLVVSADFDSARLDAASRSVLWGYGGVFPQPVPAPIRTPNVVILTAAPPGASRWRRRFRT